MFVYRVQQKVIKNGLGGLKKHILKDLSLEEKLTQERSSVSFSLDKLFYPYSKGSKRIKPVFPGRAFAVRRKDGEH